MAAYGQVFFSLSVAFATMITYASYLQKDADLSNSGLIAALSNSGFEFMAAIGVFGALGFLAVQSGVDVEGVVASGPGLAFVVFPQIINELPWLNSLFGVLFFGSLVFAGLTSVVSIVEPAISGIRDKLGTTRTTAVNWVCGLSFLISFLYATKGGINYLDLIDYFVNNYGLLLGAILMTIAVAWTTRKVRDLQSHINRVSDVHIGSWWVICISFVTPLVLFIMTGMNIWNDLQAPYGGMPYSGIFTMGYGAVLITVIAGVIFHHMEWKANTGPVQVSEKEGA